METRLVKEIKYRGFNIRVIKAKENFYQATNDIGESYISHPWFKTIDEAIRWDKVNIDFYIKENA